MKVTVSSSAGFCVGVKLAIEKALETASSDTPLYMLGDIVHNEFVVSRIKEQGIKKIRTLGNGHGKSLLIRAHGAPASIYKKAVEKGYTVVDASCPMVKDIHEKARKEVSKGRHLIIVGDKDHDEVLGIKGSISKRSTVIDPSKFSIPASLKNIKKASVVVQSTQNLENVIPVVEKLSSIIPDLRFFDTICAPTKKRQKDAETLPLKNDAMLVIGSKTSANTRRLYEISLSLNPRTFLISSASDLDISCLKGAERIGVLAGASTPREIIDDIVSIL